MVAAVTFIARDTPGLFTLDAAFTWRELLAGTPSQYDFDEHNSVEMLRKLVVSLAAGRQVRLVNPRWTEAARGALRGRTPKRGALRGPTPKGGATGRTAGGDTVLYSSGSTGTPKAIAHDVSAHWASARASDVVTPFGPGDVWLLSLPLCHVGGLSLLFRAALRGGALALPPRGMSLTDALAHFGPTHLSVVPTQLTWLLDEGARPGNLKSVLVGGAPVSRDLLARARAAGFPARETYGCTELASQIATDGRPLDHLEVRVTDGHIEVRGESLARDLAGEGGWFRTGDLGRFTNGKLEVIGRADLMFISGGENVYPEEIERHLGADVVVVPVEDAQWGQRAVAFAPRARLTEVEDRARGLPALLRPIAYFEMPKDMGLKPSRAALRSIAQARRGSP